jgi:hypothetical protein
MLGVIIDLKNVLMEHFKDFHGRSKITDCCIDIPIGN